LAFTDGTRDPRSIPSCQRAVKALQSSTTTYIVTHWDADGVASAALLLRNLSPRRAYTRIGFPRIGSYSADAVPLENVGGESLVVLLDYGIPAEELDRLASLLPHNTKLVVIDHHATSPPQNKEIIYCNPVGLGKAGEQEYPSASLLVYMLSGAPSDTRDRSLALLGVAGDLAPYVESGKSHPGIEWALRATGLSSNDLKRLHSLSVRVDSCYRLLDYDCLWLSILAGVSLGANGIERLEEVDRASARAGELVRQALSQLKLVFEREGIRVYSLVFDGYVTSYVGRWLAKSSHGNMVSVLVHYIPGEGRGFIYARSLSGGLSRVIRVLRRRSLRVGGKDAVLVVEYSGVEFPVDLVEEVVEAILSEWKKK